MTSPPIALCWFRRDLRLHDHAALYHALKSGMPVHCLFVFDTDILDHLTNLADRRVEFIWESVAELKRALEDLGSTLHILHESACSIVPQFAKSMGASTVFCNRDYEPDAIVRDRDVATALQTHGIAFRTFKDQVIFECEEVLTATRKPFNVFTPYKNAWLKTLTDFHLRVYPTEHHFAALAQCTPAHLPGLETLGFVRSNLAELALPCGMSGAEQLFGDFRQRMADYHTRRDFPALKGVSYLSAHLRFGTLSIRTLAREAFYSGGPGPQTWLSELIWREFYQMLLYHYPYVVAHAFKPRFDDFQWNNDPAWFAAWQSGQTGYPLVDAGMRQLARSGYMHNRLRMVTAAFLVKDLQIDWRWGERHFAEQLIDFDLAANNGGWQWSASTGCDAQPWFRIFNPVTQSEKFDPDGRFIRRYVPELANCPADFIHSPWKLPLADQQQLGIVIGKNYPAPLIDHATARAMTLARYKSVA